MRCWALDVQTFCPSRTQWSPSRVAFVLRPARSLPAPGSENSWQQNSSARRKRRTNRSCCSGVPKTAMVGATSWVVTEKSSWSFGTSNSASSMVKARSWAGVSPPPPNFVGEAMAPKPASIFSWCQATCSARSLRSTSGSRSWNTVTSKTPSPDWRIVFERRGRVDWSHCLGPACERGEIFHLRPTVLQRHWGHRFLVLVTGPPHQLFAEYSKLGLDDEGGPELAAAGRSGHPGRAARFLRAERGARLRRALGAAAPLLPASPDLRLLGTSGPRHPGAVPQHHVRPRDLDRGCRLDVVADVGTSVLVAGYHRPVDLAQRLSTIDILSEGRLIAGFSVGWSDDEHAPDGRRPADPGSPVRRADRRAPGLLGAGPGVVRGPLLRHPRS